VFKGKKMPGRMGNARVTSQNLKVALVDVERNLIGVRGAVPGGKGTVVSIKETRKA
jgi:large subunit ribosomal protein L3